MKPIMAFLLFVTAAFAECPMGRIIVDRDLLSAYRTRNLEIPLAITFKYTNTSGKTIVGAKFRGIWLDSVEDPHITLSAFTSDAKVKPGTTKKEGWLEPPVPDGRRAWLIAPVKVLFEDGTTWEMTDADHGCFGQTWFAKREPLKVAPPLLFQ